MVTFEFPQEEKSIEGCTAVLPVTWLMMVCSENVPNQRLMFQRGSEQDLRRHQVGVPSIGQTGDGDIRPMRQLVAMFGALVAQGEKDIG